jgi:protein-disulfide isomerase-like protein with CxxC motif
MRLNFELSEAQMAHLTALKEKTGASSMKELFNHALTILDWAVEEAAMGNAIAALSPDEKNNRILVTPLLRQVARANEGRRVVETAAMAG